MLLIIIPGIAPVASPAFACKPNVTGLLRAQLLASPSCGQFSQWFGQAQQAASHFVTPAYNQLAKSANDFARFADKSQQGQRNFTMAEVAQCSGKDGGCLYIVYDGKVLDLTDFVPYHVGGADALKKYAGQDATAAMRASGMPPQVFDVFLSKFVIGHVVSAISTPAPTTAPSTPQAECGWLATSMGLCEYIVKIERIYDSYKGLITRIFIRSDATNDDELVRRYGLNYTTAQPLGN